MGKGFLTGKIDENTTFDSTDFRSTLPRFTPEALKANQAMVDLLGKIAERKQADAGSDRAGLAAGPEAVDRADPGHHKAQSRLEENIGAGCRSNSRRMICVTSTRPRLEITVQGARYPERLEKMTGATGGRHADEGPMLPQVLKLLTAALILKITAAVVFAYRQYFPPDFSSDFLQNHPDGSDQL